ncbi:MAG: cytoplasmic protein [Candidatus Marinimicrobia bacterium]|nr:cytoplasmic protein [Candidatus Neomarinimicrobiota bacterium]MCF7827756.1 cytoplasmic protein [Candidatus Neomarinimicrobiota bacterium]MCF7881444.1 cytoplasmic protein [Candidatus Neomarinimicrobiota bacterium]
MLFETIQVETYSGYKADERPTSFILQGEAYTISEIEDRWYEGGRRAGRPTLRYFKVRTTSDHRFLLRYDPGRDVWGARIHGQQSSDNGRSSRREK